MKKEIHPDQSWHLVPLVWYILKGLLSIYRLNPRLIGGEKKEGEKDEEDDEKRRNTSVTFRNRYGAAGWGLMFVELCPRISVPLAGFSR